MYFFIYFLYYDEQVQTDDTLLWKSIYLKI